MEVRDQTIRNNRAWKNSDHGIMLRTLQDSEVDGNWVANNGRGFFVYDVEYIKLRDNVVANNRIGVHLSGSPRNEVDGNDFVDNQQQVKYAGTRDLAWGGKKGNFWSNYRGWDRNDDGRGDIPYEANDMVDRLTWRYPGVRMLMASPAVQALRMVGQQFPILRVPSVRGAAPAHEPAGRQMGPLAGENPQQPLQRTGEPASWPLNACPIVHRSSRTGIRGQGFRGHHPASGRDPPLRRLHRGRQRDARRAPWRGVRPHRPQRRRQEHALQDHAGAAGPHVGQHPHRG